MFDDSEELLLGLIGLFLIFSAIILPWVILWKARQLNGRVTALEATIAALHVKTEPQKAEAPSAAVLSSTPLSSQNDAEDIVPDAPTLLVKEEAKATSEQTEKNSKVENPTGRFERQFGARLPVWIGAVALALAGLFLVKYSMENGLLGPEARVVLGFLFGLALVGAGFFLRRRPAIANGERIAQALSGSGLAVLYACLFSAATLYELIPSWLGFVGMAGVTGAAVLLSLRHGAPIALLGLAGGLVTPLLVQSNTPNAPLLFLYLYVVVGAILELARRRRWWWLAVPDALGALLWAVAWTFGGHYTPDDTLTLGLFLFAVGGTLALMARHDEPEERPIWRSIPGLLSLSTLASALLVMAVIVAEGGFGPLQWALLALLCAGGIALAVFDQARYGLIPLASLAVSLGAAALWDVGTGTELALALVIAGFGLLHLLPAVFMEVRAPRAQWMEVRAPRAQWMEVRAPRALWWSGLSAASLIGGYGLGMVRLQDWAEAMTSPHAWAVLGLGLAALAISLTRRALIGFGPALETAVHASTATALITLAFASALERPLLGTAITAEILALAWIADRLALPALRGTVLALTALFAFLLLPQIELLLELALYSLTESDYLLWQTTVPMMEWPVATLGLPALLLAVASAVLRRHQDGRLCEGFELAAISLSGLCGYALMRRAFHLDESVLFSPASFVERGLVSALLLGFGLLCLWGGRMFTRRAMVWGGLALSGLAVARIGLFDLLLRNPLWSEQEVGAWPLINALAITYLLPAFGFILLAKGVPSVKRLRIAPMARGAALFLGFVWITLSIRQAFQGTSLDGPFVEDAELYTYSAVWLALGLGMAFLGALRKSRILRVIALALIAVTVCKVFLIDASALTGLWRVAAFMGLGLSLIGLSWFFSRFVLAKD